MNNLLDQTLQSLDSPEIKNSKNLYGIDIVKFIMAIFVVGVHTAPLHSFSAELSYCFTDGLFRLAVPFFFISSSWLFFRKVDIGNIDDKKFFQYMKRLLIMYFIWTAVYLFQIVKPVTITAICHYVRVDWKYLFYFGSYNQLWYLLSSVIGMAIIYVLLKIRISPKIVYGIALFFGMLGIICFSYRYLLFGNLSDEKEALAKFFFTIRQPLLFGFPMLATGMMLTKVNIRLKRKTAVILCMCFVGLALLERGVVKFFDWVYVSDFSLFDIPMATMLLYVSANLNLKEKKIYILLRKSSILIYLIHPLFIILFEKLFLDGNSLAKYVFVVTLSVGVSMILVSFERFKYMKWLKYIH